MCFATARIILLGTRLVRGGVKTEGAAMFVLNVKQVTLERERGAVSLFEA